MTVRGTLRRLRPRRLNFLPPVAGEPDQQLPPSEIQRGMRLSIGEGIFAQIWAIVTVGSFVTGLSLQLGATNFDLGLILALPVAAQLVQLFAAWWVERSGNRRFIVVASSYGRVLWIVPPLLLFVPMDPSLRLSLAMVAMALSFGLMAVTANAWLNWMSDLIPPTLRGRFFGVRNTVTAVVSMVVLWAAGAGLDFAESINEAELGYLILYSIACVASIISTLIVSRQPEPPMRRGAPQKTGAMLLAPLRNPRFRLFMLTMSFWGFGLNLASPFIAAHALKNLNITFQELALLDVITAATSIITQPYWGQLADRLGQKRVVGICLIGASPLIFNWVWVTPSTIWALYINAVLAGIFWPGLNIALNNRLMENAPMQGRGGFIASYSAITGIAAFISALVGGLIVDALGDYHFTLGDLTINNYQIIFIAAGLLRLAIALVGRRTL